MKMLHVTIQTNKFEEEMEFYEKEVGLTLQRDMRPAKFICLNHRMVLHYNTHGSFRAHLSEYGAAW